MDVPQTPGKRKRETNVPRITYHVANRTFDRLFKEETLDETKDVVRRKLELPESSNIRLAQLRGEHIVDLEDDDDFDAFYAIAHSKMAIDVRVTIEPNPHSDTTSASPEVPNRSPPDTTSLRKRKVTFLEDQNVPPNKRRISLTSSSSNPVNGASNSESSEGSHSSPIIIPPTTPSTNASENEREPTTSEPPPPPPPLPKPPKTKKKAKVTTTDAEPIEAEREPSDANVPENRADPDPSEQPLKKPPKAKKKAKPTDAEPETEVASTTVPLENHDTALPEKPSKTPLKTKKRAKTPAAEPETEVASTTVPPENHVPALPGKPSKTPLKTKKRAKTPAAEPETEVASTTVLPENHDSALPEKPSKTPLKAKKRAKTPAAEPEVESRSIISLEEDIPQGETKKKRKRKEKAGDEATSTAPQTVTKKAKKLNTQSDTVDGNFHQQLVDKINAGNRDGNDAAEDATSESEPPPPKRVKKNSKTVSQDPKAPGKVPNGTVETTEQSEGKAKRKRSKSESKKEGERELTADERAAVAKSIMLAVQRAMPAALKMDVVDSAPNQPAKPQPLRNKVSSSADILAAARNRTASKPSKAVVNLASSSKNLPVPTKNSLASPSSESSNGDDDDGAKEPITILVQPSPLIPNDLDPYSHIDLEAVVRGPSKRRLTLDNVLPLITDSSPRRNVVLEEDPIIKPKSTRRSLARASVSSDSDEAGDESASDKVASEPKDLPSPASGSSSEPSGSGASVARAETLPVTTVVPARELIPASTDRSDERIVETSTQILDPVTPPLVNGRAPDGPDKAGGFGPEGPPTALQTTPTEEHDPIEPSIPSPRPGSPIETALPTNSPPDSGRLIAKAPLKPEMRLPQPRRSTRKGNSQPIMQHEVDVRESVVRLTRSRSKPNVQVPSASLPTVPGRHLRSTPHADPPVSTDPSPAAIIMEHSPSEAPDNLWTTLNAGPSSTVDAESAHGTDELHSSPELDPDPPAVASDPEAPDVPLFMASESQVGFPYSQFQDLDADTDVTGFDPALGSVSRLEADSEEEDEVEETITVQPSRRNSTAYRGLSQITSQNKFFTGFQPHSVLTSTPRNPNEDMYGPLSQAYDDDEEGSDSGSNSDIEKSHIPKGRRAGNKR